MNKPLKHLAAILALAASASALAQPTPVPLTDGEVQKVDAERQRLTLKHGEIKHLDMMPMTMVFRVKDKTLMDKVKAGDKVRFAVEKIDGHYVVTAIDAMK